MNKPLTNDPDFRFARFSDVFKPEDMPSDGIKYAVLSNGQYRMGGGSLARAIRQAGAWLTVGHKVVIACADIREVIDNG